MTTDQATTPLSVASRKRGHSEDAESDTIRRIRLLEKDRNATMRDTALYRFSEVEVNFVDRDGWHPMLRSEIHGVAPVFYTRLLDNRGSTHSASGAQPPSGHREPISSDPGCVTIHSPVVYTDLPGGSRYCGLLSAANALALLNFPKDAEQLREMIQRDSSSKRELEDLIEHKNRYNQAQTNNPSIAYILHDMGFKLSQCKVSSPADLLALRSGVFLVTLQDERGDRGHMVAVDAGAGAVVDSAESYVLPLTQPSLNTCCSGRCTQVFVNVLTANKRKSRKSHKRLDENVPIRW